MVLRGPLSPSHPTGGRGKGGLSGPAVPCRCAPQIPLPPLPSPAPTGLHLPRPRRHRKVSPTGAASRPPGGAAVRGRCAAGPRGFKTHSQPPGDAAVAETEAAGAAFRSRLPGTLSGSGPGSGWPCWGCFSVAAAAASLRLGPNGHRRLRACPGARAGARVLLCRAPAVAAPGSGVSSSPERFRPWFSGTGGDAVSRLPWAASGCRAGAGRGKPGETAGKRVKTGAKRGEPGPFRPFSPPRGRASVGERRHRPAEAAPFPPGAGSPGSRRVCGGAPAGTHGGPGPGPGPAGCGPPAFPAAGAAVAACPGSRGPVVPFLLPPGAGPTVGAR
ncbi:probetacellulin isoform X1 [Accipiter gentilis]|uniref:probetacellulin isoform X1 n=1 Tax=Astur gentilis TaxID=8957 RepID=UPI00211023CD|nr:probetacellulin isoform X1 [Accipiter gentilis]XP_049671333.1 probetacellulin isoform X1 [Accipiter gentilis]XP_049671334.1 probetacellulin isoform X1 [Accipiter gentilis]XP_049671335.1 probetacellulin isoform X1 [Accipiter gentilis]